MLKAADPWYVHAILYAVITILVIILIKVAILDPQEIVAVEKYNKSESRLRMDNLKEAEILWEKKFGNFTDDLEGLVQFIKQDPFVDSVVNAFDSLTMKPANPFNPLTHGEFMPDSLMRTPRSGSFYILQIDTSFLTIPLLTGGVTLQRSILPLHLEPVITWKIRMVMAQLAVLIVMH